MKRFLLSAAFIFLHFITAQSQTAEEKASKLLNQMTLEEKIGQMAQLNITTIMTDSLQKHYDSVSVYQLDSNKLIRFVKEFHIGSFLNGRGVPKESWYEYMYDLQRINHQHSRLKIPILYGVDHVHGSSYLKEGTIFPHNINIAATFDTAHAVEMAKVTVYETSGLGHQWIFAPVMDLGRNKFWGRYYETFGEDPVVASGMGAAYIRALQVKDPLTQPYGVAGCAKHFIGYSDPKSGWDRSPAEIPDQILREFFLPSFKAAINAGVKTLMVNSGELNGIPVHTSYELLNQLLRKELGFKGVVVTDWLDIISLRDLHFVAENEKEATFMAIQAGIDMSMIPLTTDFCRYVKELVQEGRITEERINESVLRILTLKYDLGLFDQFLPDKNRLSWIGKPESKLKALNAARESIVLIKNEKGILPVNGKKKILVTGELADLRVSLSGGWTYRFAPTNDHWFPKEVKTLLQGIKEEFKGSEVVYSNLKDLPLKAKTADLIIFAAGEKEGYAETDGTIDDLALSESQMLWAQKVFEQKKPVVTILIEGRPRILGNIFDKSNAVIWAGLPGIEGARAIAEVLNGTVNPSGKMPFTYPNKQGHIVPYNHKKSEYSTYRPVSEELKRFSIAEFGTGLSYTTFKFSNLKISDSVVTNNGALRATVTITNTGNLKGKEAVLWFVSDEVGTISRPVKELQEFSKIELNPGESKEVTFDLQPSKHLAFPDKNGKELLEPGYFNILVADSKIRAKLVKK